MEELDIEEIRKLYSAVNIRFTLHAVKRLEERKIFLTDIASCISNGMIIEQYPDDYPYPSCLISGLDTAQDHIHIVVGCNGKELFLITAYRPDPERWEPDFKTRKENLK